MIGFLPKPLHHFVDLSRAHRHQRSELLLYDAVPGNIAADLAFQRGARNAAFLEKCFDLVDGHVGALGNAFKRLVHLFLADLDVKPLRFLALKIFIDERP